MYRQFTPQTPRQPNPRIVSQSSGKPVSGFVGVASEEFEARIQDFGDFVEWAAEWTTDPPNVVEFVGEQYDWKRRFRITGNGKITVTLTDANGFHFHVPPVFVRLSVSNNNPNEV